jgi:hypothetical protein
MAFIPSIELVGEKMMAFALEQLLGEWHVELLIRWEDPRDVILRHK